tara:strand:- start:305 stop:820 length:516 start_codon:yes stop_codon:yes gene_type:complete
MNNTYYDFAYREEALQNDKAILRPGDHELRFDAYLMDLDYLATPNCYGEYIATYQPLDMGAIHMIMEAGERALSEVLMSMASCSLKEPRPNFETKDGLILTSQLWPPKLNIDPEDRSGPFFQNSPQVSVKAHFSDRRDGMVYLHAQFVDFYESIQVPVVEAEDGNFTDIDF